MRSAKPDVVLLEGGCLCCTVRGELTDTLRDLLFKRGRDGIPKFNRVLIETTGLADPAPILQTLISDPIVAQHYRLDGVITTVDGVLGMGELDRHFESVKQAAVADRIVLTKSDAARHPISISWRRGCASSIPPRPSTAPSRAASIPRCS